MKNQYFGDVGDYGKYGLLRFLAKHGISLAINWYLTPDDVSNDGNIRGYLEDAKNRIYDPELYDTLREMRVRHEKDVQSFARREMIPGAIYYGEIVGPIPDDRIHSVIEKKMARNSWHQAALGACTGPELVFMDPDNGLRPGSPSAQKHAAKYVYANEVCDYYDRGQNIVYYCHKGRRTVAQWDKAKHVLFEYRPHASLMGVTYHRGTQRSYIFMVHPEQEARYRFLLKGFLKTAWADCFTDEFMD